MTDVNIVAREVTGGDRMAQEVTGGDRAARSLWPVACGRIIAPEVITSESSKTLFYVGAYSNKSWVKHRR